MRLSKSDAELRPSESGILFRPSRYAGLKPPLERAVGLLSVVVVGLIVTFCFVASSVCITLLLAVFLSILFDPIVTRMERWHIPRPVSCSLGILSGMLVIGFIVYASYGKATGFLEGLPQYADRVRDAIEPLNQKIEQMQESAGKLTPEPKTPRRVQTVKLSEQPTWPSYLARGVGSVWGALIICGVVPFLMYFLLVRKKHLCSWFSATFGERIDVPTFLKRLSRMVRGFVLGNLLVGAILASVTVCVFLSIHMQGAVFLGILSGLLNSVPFLGVILASSIPLLAGMLQYNSIGPFLIIALTVIALHLIASNLLIPKIIGSRINIGPVAAIVGMLFWGWLWGVMGLLLAIPLTALVRLIADCHPSLTPISNLLAETPRAPFRWVATGGPVIRAIPLLRGHWRDKNKD